MAQITYRANLNAAMFPLVSQYQGQTVIVRSYDNNYVPTAASKVDDDKDIGIPQVYYCHNVVPTAQGMTAVGYEQQGNPVAGVTDFVNIFTLRNDVGDIVLFGRTAEGDNYVMLPESDDWVQINTIADTEGVLTTVAYVSGVTYIYFAGVGCYTYDYDTEELVEAVLAGIDVETVIGIIGNSGYLITWSNNSIAWSSTSDPTDFVPSLESGAGGGGVEGARGALTVLVSTVAGFIVYTTANAVASAYSGNARFPFNFREIIGCGGLLSPELAASDGNSGVQYAYTTFGLQSVSFQLAQAIFPEITDFISGRYFEDFNESTNEFTYVELDAPMVRKLYVIAGRYLVLSYGVTSLTHALYYDLALKRLGKLKVPHVDVFDYFLKPSDEVDTPKNSVGILQENGTIWTVDTTFGNELNGVMITGKYQYSRSRKLQLDSVQIQNARFGDTFSVLNFPEIDGEVYAKSEGYLLHNKENQRTYLFSDVGENHSLVFKGNFNANSVVLSFHNHGRT